MLSSEEASKEHIAQSGFYHRVYLPKDNTEKHPAVVLAHGRAGDAKVMWTFTKTLEKVKPVVVSPQGDHPDPIGGYSWWVVDHGSGAAPRTFQSEIIPPLDKFEHFVKTLPQIYPVDRAKIYAAGFSQGAALVLLASLRNPKLFRGVAILGGFLPKSFFLEQNFIDNDVLEKKAPLPRYFIAHGSNDNLIPLERGLQVKSTLEALGAEVTFVADPVGHKVGASGMQALKKWFEEG